MALFVLIKTCRVVDLRSSITGRAFAPLLENSLNIFCDVDVLKQYNNNSEFFVRSDKLTVYHEWRK